jgi:aldose 1-epimerase
MRQRIVPEAAGGFGRFDWRGRGTAIPSMRPCDRSLDAVIEPNQPACYPLQPWGKRIAQGGFSVDDRRISLQPAARTRPVPLDTSLGMTPPGQPVIS